MLQRGPMGQDLTYTFGRIQEVTKDAMIIDVHGHFVATEVLERRRREGSTYGERALKKTGKASHDASTLGAVPGIHS